MSYPIETYKSGVLWWTSRVTVTRTYLRPWMSIDREQPKDYVPELNTIEFDCGTHDGPIRSWSLWFARRYIRKELKKEARRSKATIEVIGED